MRLSGGSRCGRPPQPIEPADRPEQQSCWRPTRRPGAIVGINVAGGVPPLAQLALVAVCYAVGPIILQRRLSDLPAMGVIAASLAVTAILDERFTVGMGVGFALVLVGSALATRPPVPARDAEPALAGPA